MGGQDGQDGRDSASFPRVTNRAGGIEGGITNGQVIRVRGALKPISTVPRALRTVDVSTGEQTTANHQRSDTCAVAPAAVIAEAVVALTLADALLEKSGGDCVAEIRAHLGRAQTLPSAPTARRPDRGPGQRARGCCWGRWGQARAASAVLWRPSSASTSLTSTR